ncbi:trigger factor-like [Haliotis rubra]|uniref:trigger factor-like n=1 Tax=Haliotis rubra TaxID=36100 RepID=UPI001EE5E61B|nr:trigger factor-like [Haliotis rubra]
MKELKDKVHGLIHKESDDDDDYEDADYDDGDFELADAGKDYDDVLDFGEDEDEDEDEGKPEKKSLNERFKEFQKKTAQHFAGLHGKLKG